MSGIPFWEGHTQIEGKESFIKGQQTQFIVSIHRPERIIENRR